MGAGSIAPRDEGRLFVFDSFECLGNVPHALDAGRIALGADQHEVVVHHRVTLHAFSLGEKFLLCRFGVHKDDVSISAPAGIERLAGALRDDFHLDAGLLLEQRQDVTEQAGILRRCRRRHHDRFVLCMDGSCKDRRSEGGHGYQRAAIQHVILHTL